MTALIEQLDQRLFFHVLSFLDFTTLAKIQAVCKKWHALIESEVFWKYFLPTKATSQERRIEKWTQHQFYYFYTCSTTRLVEKSGPVKTDLEREICFIYKILTAQLASNQPYQLALICEIPYKVDGFREKGKISVERSNDVNTEREPLSVTIHYRFPCLDELALYLTKSEETWCSGHFEAKCTHLERSFCEWVLLKCETEHALHINNKLF